MRILDHSLSLARVLFPAHESKRLRKFHHFCFIYRKNKLLSVGMNNPEQLSNKAYWMAQRFDIKKWKMYPYLHAEIDAIQRLWGRVYVDQSLRFVCVRLNRFGDTMLSKPCRNCATILEALNVDKIWWTDGKGGFGSYIR